ncbi:MAG: plasma-membrane proton-efflux P-type ATPase [Nitrososphaerota archaeon]|nr:plasma-membrane proton-efflux P-type ATPase [Nitrososphaerota archaeon]MDG6930780.1 plasma-membrane proton-efflux P-type ATPase [Nitrososphaerota archaeon]
MPLTEFLKDLDVDPEKGLSEEDVKSRLSKYGFNEIEEEKRNPLKSLGKKFWGLTPWMLEITMVFSFLIGKYIDGYVIGALLVLNAIIGYTQEERASRAVELLKKRLQVSARVLRNSLWKQIPSRELVPGDIVRVRAGDFVPADLKIINGEAEVDQSALTGESMPVSKKALDDMYSGSTVRRGESTCVVVKTGKNTYFGKTTELVQFARPKLHIESIISKIVEYLLVIVVVLIGLMFVLTYMRGLSIIPVIPLALMLIVFAVPVALPAMFTVTMALGSLEIAKEGALLTRLNAIEDAASMDVMCADKTGTLTQNRLFITDIISAPGFSENDVVRFGALASQEANQDPIDMAFLNYARKINVDLGSYKVVQFVPFDPATRRTEAEIIKDASKFRVIKGAVNTITSMCKVGLEDNMVKTLNDHAQKGYRSIAVAVSDGGNPRFCGIAFLYDEPREDTPELINSIKKKGISVKMLTGDAEPIAREIAKKVGLGEVVSVAAVKSEMQNDMDKAAEIAEKVEGFAEIYPEDKYVVVKSLQARKHIVGMTGDGVNDAPALRQAEVGIAVSNATDVAKAAASVVLTQEGLTGIVNLVSVGRSVYQRVVTWVLNKIVKTFEIAVFVTLAFLITGYYTISALDVVLFLFLIDFVTISLSTDKQRGSEEPEKWKISSFVKLSIILGALTVSELFLLLYIGIHYFAISSNIGVMNTFFFTAIMFFGLMFPISLREKGNFWKSRPGNTLLMAILIDIAVVSLLSLFGFGLISPIPLRAILFLIGYAVAFILLVNDNVKVLLGRLGLSR